MRSPTSSYLNDLSLISTRLSEIANEFKDDSVITGLVGQVQTSIKKNGPRAPGLIHALGKALDYIDANSIKASADLKSSKGTFGTVLRKDILAASFKTYLENDSKPSDIHNFVEFIKCLQFNSLDLGSKRFFIQEWFNPKERSFLLKSWLNISEEQGEKKLLPDTSVDAKAAGGKDLRSLFVGAVNWFIRGNRGGGAKGESRGKVDKPQENDSYHGSQDEKLELKNLEGRLSKLPSEKKHQLKAVWKIIKDEHTELPGPMVEFLNSKAFDVLSASTLETYLNVLSMIGKNKKETLIAFHKSLLMIKPTDSQEEILERITSTLIRLEPLPATLK